MRAHIGYSFGAVREARADRGARDVASRADPRPLRTPPKNGTPSIIPPSAPNSFLRPGARSPPRPAPPRPTRVTQHPAERRDRARATGQLQRPPRRGGRQQRDLAPARLLAQRAEPILQAGRGVCPEGGGEALAPARAGRGGQRRPRLPRAVPRGVRPGRQGVRRVGARLHRRTQRRTRRVRRRSGRGAAPGALRPRTRALAQAHRRVVALGHREAFPGDGAGCRGRGCRRVPR